MLIRYDQVATFWPRVPGGFGAPIIHAPGNPQGGVRWGQDRSKRFTTEEERRRLQMATVLLSSSVSEGGCIASGATPSPSRGTSPGFTK